MEPGRKVSKEATSVHQSGVTASASPTVPTVAMTPHTVSTASQNPHFAGEDDSARVLTGPGMGGSASGSGEHNKKWGHTSQSGSRIEVDDTPGSESISIIHHSGAGVVVEPDGAIYLTSTSRRGGGLSAPRGDVYLSAGGEIVIDGPGSVSIKTAGDLNLVVGGILNIVAGGIKVSTKALEENVDGYATRTVTNDQSVMIGGISRTTVAGDQRNQVSGNSRNDVGGSHVERIHGDAESHVTGSSKVRVTGETSHHSTGKMSVIGGADLNVEAKGKATYASDGNAVVSSKGTMVVSSAGLMDVASQGETKVTAGSTLNLSGSNSNLSSTGSTIVSGSDSTIGGSVVKLATGTVLGPIPSGSGGSVSAFKDSIPAPASASAAEAPAGAEVPEANDVVDNLTSARKYPDYPNNAVHESAYNTNNYQVSHDSGGSADGVYSDYSGGNKGNGNPSYSGGSFDTLPDTPVNRDPNIESMDPGMAVPSRNDNSAKISKYFTLGALTRAPSSNPIPQSKWNEIVKNHILLAYNCLDKIKEKFPDIIVTSAYRSYGTNHPTGRAADIVVASRSMTAHAEIARFARDHLPIEKVLLERNDSGRTHVHIQVSPTGKASSNPVVLTCGDKNCKVSTPGINVEWLERNV